MNRRLLLFVSMLLVVVTLGAGCGGATTESDGAVPAAATDGTSEVEADSETTETITVIRIANTGVGYEAISVPVLEFILVEGYGYEVETVSMTVPQMQAALEAGEIHVSLAAMSPETETWFGSGVAGGAIIDRGTLYKENGTTYGKAVHPSFETAYPDVFKMLRKMKFELRDLVGVAEWAQKEGVTDPAELAANYLGTIKFEDRWKAWMPNGTYRTVYNYIDQNYIEYSTCFHCPAKEGGGETKRTGD